MPDSAPPAADRPLLSIVSPVYQGAALLDELVARLHAAAGGITPGYEIILVDDGSPDAAWPHIQRLAAADGRVRGLRLTRNFGQHRALTAGFDHCRGEWVLVLDCDLQDPPEALPELLRHAQQQQADYVVARRGGAARADAWWRRASSRLFYRVLSGLTGVPQDAGVGNFGLYHRRVIDAVRRLPERNRFFPVMVRWVGMRGSSLVVPRAPRPSGRSAYSLTRRLNLALDVLLAWSDRPLRLAVQCGLGISALALVLGLITLLRFVLGQITVAGYTSLVLLMCFFCGLIITVLGMVGLYVGQTFEEAKQRPLYLVDETTEAGRLG
jgi:polyisoprenyl-phosphate glycosyltransferase